MNNTTTYSVAQFKRDIEVGRSVTIENHVFPGLSGTFPLSRAQTTKFARWVTRPQDGKTVESWIDIPPASLVEVAGPSSLTFYREAEWGDDGPFLTVTVHLDDE